LVGIPAVRRHAQADPSGAFFFSAFARKKRPRLFSLKWCFWLANYFLVLLALFVEPQKCHRRKFIDRTNDMAVGPTRTLARSGSERRPNRHGANTSHKAKTTRREHIAQS